jgi:hypothetical protein
MGQAIERAIYQRNRLGGGLMVCLQDPYRGLQSTVERMGYRVYKGRGSHTQCYGNGRSETALLGVS